MSITRNNVAMATGWAPPRLGGAMHLFIADGGQPPPFDWATRVDGPLCSHRIPCRHGDMLKPGPIEAICRVLGDVLTDGHAHGVVDGVADAPAPPADAPNTGEML